MRDVPPHGGAVRLAHELAERPTVRLPERVAIVQPDLERRLHGPRALPRVRLRDPRLDVLPGARRHAVLQLLRQHGGAFGHAVAVAERVSIDVADNVANGEPDGEPNRRTLWQADRVPVGVAVASTERLAVVASVAVAIREPDDIADARKRLFAAPGVRRPGSRRVPAVLSDSRRRDVPRLLQEHRGADGGANDADTDGKSFVESNAGAVSLAVDESVPRAVAAVLQRRHQEL